MADDWPLECELEFAIDRYKTKSGCPCGQPLTPCLICEYPTSATPALAPSAFPASFPRFQELCSVPAQILATASSRVRDVPHRAFPEHAIEGLGIDPVGIVEVERLQRFGPPSCVVQLGKHRTEPRIRGLAFGNERRIDGRRAQAA